MKNTFLFLFSLFTISSFAQILEVNQPAFGEFPFFNTSFIKTNKIKTIIASRSSKKVKDIIRKKGLDYEYRFNTNGTLKSQMTTFLKKGHLKDTNIVTYQYNKEGKVICIRKSDNGGYFSNNYKLDDDGNIVKQTYCRDENASHSKNNFKLLKQYIITSDSFSYDKPSENQVKKIFYNKYHKRYKIQTSYYNEYGYLVEKYTKFLIGNSKSKISYQYDKKGRLSRIDNFSDLSQNNKISKTYIYDEIGNVLEIKNYENDKFITSKQFLYDEKTMLLTAQIIKDIDTEFIRIIQYRYTFY